VTRSAAGVYLAVAFLDAGCVSAPSLDTAVRVAAPPPVIGVGVDTIAFPKLLRAVRNHP
jgi:hypothetical protein